MRNFSEALNSGEFVITTELNPPKGTNLDALFEQAEALRNLVDAFNITDSAGANMTMAPIAAAHLMLDLGMQPILQVTGRDRNRIALEGELLAASALGITNILCMSGDPPGRGDHPDAVGVFDLKSETLLEAVRGGEGGGAMNAGADMYGNELMGAPSLFAGAVVNPGADDMDNELARMEDKVRMGAAFFQTQAVYDAAGFERFMKSARRFGVPVLAGMIVLKSARMARFLNDKTAGCECAAGHYRRDGRRRGQGCGKRPDYISAHTRSARHVRRRSHYGNRVGVAHPGDSGGGRTGMMPALRIADSEGSARIQSSIRRR